MKIENILGNIKVIPVVVIKDITETIPTLEALRDGGINCAEITFRTSCAYEAIKLATSTFKDMLIGAGTVININQAESAVKAGVKFIVSPGLSDEVANFCIKNDIPYLPGCVTPTEIIRAMSYGITTVKFFPAETFGGLNAIKSLSAAFPSVNFVPTGGVDIHNINQYLAFNKIVAIGGSFMMKGDIKNNCRELMKVLNG